MLGGVCGWLVVNSMRTEKTMFNLLSEQSLKNVWRKSAYARLRVEFGDDEGADDRAGTAPPSLEDSVEVRLSLSLSLSLSPSLSLSVCACECV